MQNIKIILFPVVFVAICFSHQQTHSQICLDNGKKNKLLNLNLKVQFNHESKIIELSRGMDYWVYNSMGNLVKKGSGSEILCENLEGGKYYLCFQPADYIQRGDSDSTGVYIQRGLNPDEPPEDCCFFTMK